MKQLVIKIFKIAMSIFYALFKLLPAKEKVTCISRQSDEITLDFQLLGDELWRQNVKTVFLMKKLDTNLLKLIGYFFHMFRQMYHLATSKIVVVDSYCILVSVLKHKKSLTIIQTWHALSAIKKFGYQTIGKRDGTSEMIAREMKMHANYDYILAASDKTALDFCKAFNSTGADIVKIGLPRIDYILRDEDAVQKEMINAYPEIAEKKNIVYVPTFRKGHPVDVDSIARKFDYEKYNLIVKIHPLDEITPRESRPPHLFIDEKFNTYDWLRMVDVVISDYSSFVIEATLVNKPLYLYAYDLDRYTASTGLNINFATESIGRYLFQDAEKLVAELGEKYDYRPERELRKKYIEVDTDNCSKQLADFIIKKMGEVRS